MNEIKVSLDCKGYKSKPTSDMIGQISNRIGKNDRIVALGDIENFKLFAEYVGNQGFTFSPATFRNESRSITNFDQMQLLALDFDKEIVFSDVIDRTTKINLHPFMAYETLTSEGQNKFRVLLQNNTPITDKRLAKITLNALTTIFPEADSSCDEISRMFFGGKNFSICLAEHFIYRKASEEEHLKEDCIVFLKPWKFKNIKHIMVSATVDKDICEYCFSKQNVKFYECKRAAYIGILNQYYDKSMSRSCIDGNPGIIQRIRNWSGFRYIITFKKYGIGDMHFGNAIGCDHLKGKDIDVIGTPYQVEFVYKLLPFTLGIHINNMAKMKICKVTHNGYIFHFKTFGEEHEVLRKFHIWIIESELERTGASCGTSTAASM